MYIAGTGRADGHDRRWSKIKPQFDHETSCLPTNEAVVSVEPSRLELRLRRKVASPLSFSWRPRSAIGCQLKIRSCPLFPHYSNWPLKQSSSIAFSPSSPPSGLQKTPISICCVISHRKPGVSFIATDFALRTMFFGCWNKYVILPQALVFSGLLH